MSFDRETGTLFVNLNLYFQLNGISLGVVIWASSRYSEYIWTIRASRIYYARSMLRKCPSFVVYCIYTRNCINICGKNTPLEHTYTYMYGGRDRRQSLCFMRCERGLFGEISFIVRTFLPKHIGLFLARYDANSIFFRNTLYFINGIFCKEESKILHRQCISMHDPPDK